VIALLAIAARAVVIREMDENFIMNTFGKKQKSMMDFGFRDQLQML